MKLDLGIGLFSSYERVKTGAHKTGYNWLRTNVEVFMRWAGLEVGINPEHNPLEHFGIQRLGDCITHIGCLCTGVTLVNSFT